MSDSKDVDGVVLIAEERWRQIEVEGWTPEHDHEHGDGELATAAACYALPQEYVVGERSLREALWPWDWSWWKPSPNDRLRELAKAGALVAAEIDRILRNHEEDPQP